MAMRSSMIQGLRHACTTLPHMEQRSTCPRQVTNSRRPCSRPYHATHMRETNPLTSRRQLVIAAVAAPPDSPTSSSSPESPALVRSQPSSVINPNPVPIDQAAMGLRFYSDGSATFRVWAPHASYAVLQVAPPQKGPPPPRTTPDDDASGDTAAAAADSPPWQPRDVQDVPMERVGDTWACKLPPGSISNRSPYRVLLHTDDGTVLERR
eukprot:GHUV01029287.1.p1 GENE.GHUV01029287.1~~GHUV01029287.1.p1  ORF type:complete len:209 (-),score=41.33 GHUV01029287.1:821-1447(-)